MNSFRYFQPTDIYFGAGKVNKIGENHIKFKVKQNGVVIDAIRCCKIARDRKIGGPLISSSAYFMKHPPRQFSDEIARQMLEDFIKGIKNI